MGSSSSNHESVPSANVRDSTKKPMCKESNEEKREHIVRKVRSVYIPNASILILTRPSSEPFSKTSTSSVCLRPPFNTAW